MVDMILEFLYCGNSFVDIYSIEDEIGKVIKGRCWELNFKFIFVSFLEFIFINIVINNYFKLLGIV